VTTLCEVAGMSRSNYYKNRRLRKKKAVESDKILDYVRDKRKSHKQIGGRKLLILIESDLEDNNIHIGRDRFFKLLGKNNLLIKRKRKYCRTTYSNHPFKVYTNILKDADITGPNQAFVSDITYLRTIGGFVYLALVMDVFSRTIVGWDCSDSLESLGTQRALKMALKQLPAGARIIHHSDRGSQYCCYEYVKLLKEHSISMTEENHCYENAIAERLNGILKQEYELGYTFKDKKHAKKAVREGVYLYNNHRPHMSLDYRVPADVHEATLAEVYFASNAV